MVAPFPGIVQGSGYSLDIAVSLPRQNLVVDWDSTLDPGEDLYRRVPGEEDLTLDRVEGLSRVDPVVEVLGFTSVIIVVLFLR